MIPTVEGEEELEIRPGTQPGTELRLRGRGVPHVRRPGSRGDLHVFVNVAVPTRLSRKQRETLQAYAEASGEAVSDGGILERVRDALG
jgi:molecular chaperone DnaJ